MTPIDYRMIADAQDAFEAMDYRRIEVPWVVPREIVLSTGGEEAARREALAYREEGLRCVVGSAEQGFIDLIRRRLIPAGRYQAASPCFRQRDGDEPGHHPWFFKLELCSFRAGDTPESLAQDALDVFHGVVGIPEAYVTTATDDEADLDIVCAGTELGSYGVRRVWGSLRSPDEERYEKMVYGTGLALPRAQEVVDALGARVRPDPGYHLRPIARGTVGESSKIREELLELEDAEAQGVALMAMQEAADIVGACGAWARQRGLTLQDLVDMAEVTRRAFESGERE